MKTTDIDTGAALTGSIEEINAFNGDLGNLFNEIFGRSLSKIKTTVEITLDEGREITLICKHKRGFYNER
ncbi:hypothetical protein [Acidisoma cladoniae]|jgi:hypothetical protein|uniref:hypothetical protein n=1 Tax=Acidisoma cladoniae TaxID=3040935 RepID=UPI002551B3CA|nr:hypothetical protein [Acidisoma sp. PAMC 29798]